MTKIKDKADKQDIAITVKLESAGDGSFVEVPKKSKATRKRKGPAAAAAGALDPAAVTVAGGEQQQPVIDRNAAAQPVAEVRPAGSPVIAQPIEPPETSSPTGARPKKVKPSGEPKSQKAFEDKKQKEAVASVVSPKAPPSDEKSATILSKLLGAGGEVAKNTDAKEAVGLATLGPITGAISEMASLGSSIKDTALGVIDKFRGDDKGKAGDKAADAQIKATEQVKTAVGASDKAQDERNKQLIQAIQKPQKQAIKAASTGEKKHAEAVSVKRDKAASKESKGSKKDKAGSGKKEGGVLSGISGMLMGGAGAIGGLLMAAAPVILTVVGSLLAVHAGTKAFQGFNDTEGQKKVFGPNNGEDTGLIKKIAYAVMNVGGVTSEKIDAGVEQKRDRMGLQPGEKGTITQVLRDFFGMEPQAAKISRHTINKDGTSQEKGKESGSSLAKMLVEAPAAFMQSVLELMTGGGKIGGAGAGGNASAAIGQMMGGGRTYGTKSSHISDAMAASHSGLGSLSSKYESGGDPGAVNDNDVGKAAYGMFQMRDGVASNFVKNTKWAKDFEGLKEGTPEFKAKWQGIANSPDRQAFADAQHESIKQSHYDPVAEHAAKMGIDMSSPAMQNVVWSTAVQHGGAGGGQDILNKAFAGLDPEAIKALPFNESSDRIYAERGRKDINGNLVHFPRVKGANAQMGLSDRFMGENWNAKSMNLAANNAPTLPKLAQPIDQLLSPEATQPPMTAAVAQPVIAPTTTPQPIATPIQAPEPQRYPIVMPKPEPQPVVIAGGGSGGYGGGGSGGQGGGGFKQPQVNRQQPQSQPQKLGSNIPMEFDDSLLTLMVHDLM